MSDPNAWMLPTYYSRDRHGDLRLPFAGSENIVHNFSQCYQDMFVLSATNGKRGGSYVEIGSNEPYYSSNTALLETVFEWTGVSIDIDPDEVARFSKTRRNRVTLGDATSVDYDALFEALQLGPDFDFLQVDCEPASVTLAALTKIPLAKYRFAVITFEHDSYHHQGQGDVSAEVLALSRSYLKGHGYSLVADNISVDDMHPFEDWWVHPELVDADSIARLECVTDETKCAATYMLGGYGPSQ